MTDRIVIKGAREHNLKDVDLELPRNALIVFTGISGSGKSSLAFDTIYAEGQRRYVESLSSYARQFLGQMEKPDVDFVEGLSPAVSIDQKARSHNPRSTVGTITEIYDYLRLLFARIGKPHCPKCGKPIKRQSSTEIVDRVLSLPEGSKAMILAPVIRGRKGEYESLLTDLSKQGYVRAKIDGEIVELGPGMRLDRYKIHTIEVVVDRVVIKREARRRIADSIETALALSGGVAEVELVPDGFASTASEAARLPSASEKADSKTSEVLTFSQHLACLACDVYLDELAPRNFSFNSPYGACEACSGLGIRLEVDPDLVVPDKELSLSEGALKPWGSGRSRYFDALLEAVATEHDIDMNKPWKALPKRKQKLLLYGAPDPVLVRYRNRFGRLRSYWAEYEGVIPWLERRYQESETDRMREQIENYMREVPCHSCGGARLRPESLAVKIAGLNIAEVAAMSVEKLARWIADLRLDEREMLIASRVVKEISSRLQFLCDVGLDYLTLDRPASTLAGGESQRIRLATQIGSGLVGVLYVLDEPSIGLHQRDNKRLIETLLRLRDMGNTLIVVEHDEETIRSADFIVDMGPGAGERGGEVVVAGTIEDVMSEPRSITGAYLSGKKKISVPRNRRAPGDRWLAVVGAREHNLKDIDVRFPLGCFICVTGVSGSGKSTLVNDILHKACMAALYGSRVLPGAHRKIEGIEHLDKVIAIDQSPIGRTPRSNPATYTGVFDHIRRLFSMTQEARLRGYQPGRFSFNVAGGRCEACAGDGSIRIEMHFLPDVYVPCEVCKGARYNRETLEVTYKGVNIADVLDMSVDDALAFFENHPAIVRHLQTLSDVGLGYIKLGQPATTLSGGEAQRVKLASELSKRATGRTLYILDEPTTGLHFDDVSKLLSVLQRLVDASNTVIVIEHNLDVIKCADWVVDLGPEGGDKGGEVVAEGSPEAVANVERSYTGRFLRRVLAA
jgi:excinuclease ABC subunit A